MLKKFFLPLGMMAALSACSTPPAGLDLALTRPSAQHKYVVTVNPLLDSVAINQLHSWQIKLATPDGAPVTQARFSVDGGMPQHGHGLPTRPRVTRELGEGRYLLEGMKFSMAGWWELKLAIDAAPGSDNITFNTVVALPEAGKR
ncbi:hypothetical protein ACFDR9_002202 [Janthinobacterium sp. CG_23.3]|uniref:FixH family protein n=1 Tax=Janthinobacterium sp. CG_23.3 TaxID=3349634 RepID=UPI0038D4EC99